MPSCQAPGMVRLLVVLHSCSYVRLAVVDGRRHIPSPLVRLNTTSWWCLLKYGGVRELF